MALGLLVLSHGASAALEVLVGEGGNASIDCTASGQPIRITSATYGTLSNPALTCDATAHVTAACDGQLTCSVNANNGICGDPNPGTVKQLRIVYQCGTPATPASPSEIIRKLQTSVTKSVAVSSGQVISNAIGGGISDGFRTGGTPASFGPGGGFVSFTSEPRPGPAARAREAFAALPDFGAPRRLEREWNLWADVRGTGWKIDDASGDLKGGQINATVGLGRKLNADLLVGAVGGYEHFKYDLPASSSTMRGHGVTAGAYVARRFANLRAEAALTWSHMFYRSTAGTASGSFTGNRLIASAALTGSHSIAPLVVEPSASVYALLERQTGWTDSAGTAHDARTFTAGRTALGGRAIHSIDHGGGWTLAPYAGFYADWRFSTDNAPPTGAPVANLKDGWSGRATAGLVAGTPTGGSVALAGEYGGLGAPYKIWSGSVRARAPF